MDTRAVLALLLLAPCAAHAAPPSDPVACLANNIYYEAAFEPYDGKVAVAQVTVNRTADPAYPADICGVVYYKRVIDGKKVAAFSWTLGRAWRGAGAINQRIYAECVWIAMAMLDGTLRSKRIDGSVEYYHAVYVHPAWRHMRLVAQIGNHVFLTAVPATR